MIVTKGVICYPSVSCSECNGIGTVLCPLCRGTGKVYFGNGRNNTCHTCEGRGKLICGSCDGNGRLPIFNTTI